MDFLRRQKGAILLIAFSYLFFYTTFDLAHYTFHSLFAFASSPLVEDDIFIHQTLVHESGKKSISPPPVDEGGLDCPFALLINNLSSKVGAPTQFLVELSLISFFKPRKEAPVIEEIASLAIPRAPPTISLL
ncbi:MAG: hypothetical protein J7L64_05340 [Acidobacteria bacterium]|nr:hypothetical protein [Acidobacteriota bacterium]